MNTEMGGTWPRPKEAKGIDGPRSWTTQARFSPTVSGARGSCRHAGLEFWPPGPRGTTFLLPRVVPATGWR